MNERQLRAARSMANNYQWTLVRVETAGAATVDITRIDGSRERYVIRPDGSDAVFLASFPPTTTGKRPYRGMRGDWVIEQEHPQTGVWTVLDGAMTHQQRLVDGQLLPILECACGMAWRVPTLEDCESVFAALASEHERYLASYVHDHERPDASLYSRIADRIRQGFDREYVASLGFPAASVNA